MVLKSRLKNIYSDIESTIANIKTNPIQKFIDDLQYELDQFFFESKCLGIVYTENFDKPFFGFYIMPDIDADDVIRTITTDKEYRITKYYLELDSKIFSETNGLTPSEITALLIHNISMMVSNSSPSKKVVKAIDDYLVMNKETLKLSSLVHYKEILSYGFRDAIRKVTNIFETGVYNKEEDTLSEFIDWDNYVAYIENGLSKLDKMGHLFINKEVKDKFIFLSWILRIYRDVVGYRIPTNITVEKFMELTPSKLERKELDNLAKRINRIDDDMLLENFEIKDNILEEIRDCYKFRFNHDSCLNEAKEDIVAIMIKKDEYNEPDAIPDLIHSINSKMAIMKDYAENNVTDKTEFRQWNDMFRTMAGIRSNVIKNKWYVPSRKMVNTYRSIEDQ